MKAAIYIRTNQGQEMKADKIFVELYRLYTYVLLKGYEMSPNNIYGDMGSANTFPRPGVDNLIKDAKSKQFDILLVTSIDRLARNKSISEMIIRPLRQANVRVRVVN